GALVVTGAVALGVDRIAFRPMRSRRPFSLAIASIGVAFILENVVRFVWGNDFRSYDVPVSRAMSVAGLRIGREQLLILGVAVGVMALAQAFLLRTRLGIAMRATADNALLAAAKGVPTERVIAAATLGGGALAGGAGVFLGLDASIDPLMGGGLIISVFAAAILGGIGSAPGALAGALIVGVMEEVGTLAVPPAYKTAIGFTIILALLLVRPTGLAGAGAGLAMIALRLREDYLAIVTLGFAEVLRLFLLNEAWLTRGANGVTAIPRPLHGQFAAHYDLFYLALVLGTVALAYAALER